VSGGEGGQVGGTVYMLVRGLRPTWYTVYLHLMLDDQQVDNGLV
jgi:hypothetical protein